MELSGKVAIVTGGSRGAGRGIAIELALAGMKVYVTGRSRTDTVTTEYEENTLDHTVAFIEEAGGTGIAVECDHNNEEQMREVYSGIIAENNTIDILVNNVWAGYMKQGNNLQNTLDDFTEPFWKQPLWRWDVMMNTTARSNFIVSQIIALQMIKQQSGLIVTTGFWDDDKYLSNLPYDIVKHVKNRMMYGMAIELQEYNVVAISLSLGWIRTEHIHHMYGVDDFTYTENEELATTESTRYGGRAIVALARDENLMAKTGKTLRTGELAREYDFTDVDGSQPDVFVIPDKSKGITQR